MIRLPTYAAVKRLPFGVMLALFILVLWSLTALFDPLIESLVRYHFGTLNTSEALLPPLSQGAEGTHWLGTDELGRDLAAGMIHGARVAFLISFLTMFLAVSVGLMIGLVIGYFGDRGIKKNIPQQISMVLGVITVIYYLLAMSRTGITMIGVALVVAAISASYMLVMILGRLPLRRYGVPLDMVVQRLFELRESVPSLFIILSLAAIVTSPSILSLSVIMAVLFWMTFARHARAETLAIREADYVVGARSSGVSDLKLLVGHILPNAMPAIYIIIAFSFSSVILLESSLSFLGIGIPLEEVSWGKILASARKSPKAWWLAVFPGMAIFMVLFAFNRVAEYLARRDRL